MLAGVVVAVFDRERQAQDDLLLALLQLPGGRGYLARKVGGAVVELSDGKSEPYEIAKADLHLQALRTLRQKIGGAGLQRSHPHFIAFDRADHHEGDLGELRKRPE